MSRSGSVQAFSGEALKGARESRQLSQEQFCELVIVDGVSVSKRTIERAEAGKNVARSTALAIERALGLERGQIFDYGDSKSIEEIAAKLPDEDMRDAFRINAFVPQLQIGHSVREYSTIWIGIADRLSVKLQVIVFDEEGGGKARIRGWTNPSLRGPSHHRCFIQHRAGDDETTMLATTQPKQRAFEVDRVGRGCFVGVIGILDHRLVAGAFPGRRRDWYAVECNDLVFEGHKPEYRFAIADIGRPVIESESAWVVTPALTGRGPDARFYEHQVEMTSSIFGTIGQDTQRLLRRMIASAGDVIEAKGFAVDRQQDVLTQIRALRHTENWGDLAAWTGEANAGFVQDRVYIMDQAAS